MKEKSPAKQEAKKQAKEKAKTEVECKEGEAKDIPQVPTTCGGKGGDGVVEGKEEKEEKERHWEVKVARVRARLREEVARVAPR
jgi:hypothetical protein